MENQFKKITWVIKNFPSLQSKILYSDNFLVGGCKWNILADPKGMYAANYLSLFLQVANHESLPTGWRRHAKVCLVLVNRRPGLLSLRREMEHWFETMEVHNGVETMEVHGFQLLPSQAKSVSLIFERHAEIASDFRPVNPNLKTGYMSLLLGLIETMCQLPQDISWNDLSDTYVALGSLRNAGFKLDWLDKKLDEISEIKKSDEASVIGLQEMEEQLKDLKQKCSALEKEMLAMEALVEKEKGKVSDAKAPISFHDVV